jgi:hypothetical protein
MPRAKHRTPPKPGSTFKREYQGKSYTLSVVEQSGRLQYRLKGEVFTSPSAAAQSLTKYSVNGWLFWHMDKAEKA